MSNAYAGYEEWFSETGVWLKRTEHQHDIGLKQCLVDEFSENETFYDFGCGDAAYARALIDNGHSVACYDGNPATPKITDGLGEVLDLTSDFDFGPRDWVICLEVGEHIPKEYESKLLDNITKHASKGVIMSWAVPGQKGTGHVNLQPNDYVIDQMRDRGFHNLPQLQQKLRSSILTYEEWLKEQKQDLCVYFINTLLTFGRDLTV